MSFLMSYRISLFLIMSGKNGMMWGVGGGSVNDVLFNNNGCSKSWNSGNLGFQRGERDGEVPLIQQLVYGNIRFHFYSPV